jgi:endoglucanase
MGAYPTGVPYRGLNRAGGEYLDDWDGWTGQLYYDIPAGARLTAELAFWAGCGFNTIRLPVSWERLQHELGGPLDPAYTGEVTDFVAHATAAGWLVVVDLHTYNRYASGAFGPTGAQVPPGGGYVQRVYGDGVLGVTALVDVWTRLALLLAGDDHVAFGLMNEPHDFPVTSDVWFADLQQVIDAIRGAGAEQLVLVPNSRGSDVGHWDTYAPNGGPLDSVAALAITDSGNNYAFDVHAYLAPGAAISYPAAVQPITSWAREHGRRLFLSELGVVDDDPVGAARVGDLLAFLDAASDVWLGWTPWNLSPYRLTTTDDDGTVRAGPQLPWYQPHLQPHIVDVGPASTLTTGRPPIRRP